MIIKEDKKTFVKHLQENSEVVQGKYGRSCNIYKIKVIWILLLLRNGIPISFGPDLLKTGREAVFVYSHTIWNK